MMKQLERGIFTEYFLDIVNETRACVQSTTTSSISWLEKQMTRNVGVYSDIFLDGKYETFELMHCCAKLCSYALLFRVVRPTIQLPRSFDIRGQYPLARTTCCTLYFIEQSHGT